MFEIILATMILLVVTLLLYASTKPDTFRLQRSTTISAPADKVLPFINDFHSWPSWSSWEMLDPQLKRSYGGAPQGKGARYDWDGNSTVGTGSMEIMEAASSKIKVKIDFFKPFEAHNFAEFTLEPQGNTTTVIWALYGPQSLSMKVIGLCCSPEHTVGAQFETSLDNLKALAEQ